MVAGGGTRPQRGSAAPVRESAARGEGGGVSGASRAPAATDADAAAADEKEGFAD